MRVADSGETITLVRDEPETLGTIVVVPEGLVRLFACVDAVVFLVDACFPEEEPDFLVVRSLF